MAVIDAQIIYNRLTELNQEIVLLRQLVEEQIRITIPYQIWVQNLRDANYHLTHPIPISVVEEDGQYVLSFHDVNLFAYGDNLNETLDDLCEEIVSYFEALEAEQERLGPLPAKDWIYLKELIQSMEEQ
jgi:hypothetical protein